MNLSYWELDTYFRNVDFAIVGSGIVGLSTAYHLRLRHPRAKILILEKGMLPEGASTKNAGFACFGTLSEIIGYLETNSEEDIYRLVERRHKGIQKLRALLGDETIDYRHLGGFEIFRNEDRDLMDSSLSRMDEINAWLRPIFGEPVYRKSTAAHGFANALGMIETPFEGQIHTGKMMNALTRLIVSNNIAILNTVEVTNLSDQRSGVTLELNHTFTFNCRNVFLCTNAFTPQLYPLDVVPARAQVLVTEPIANLRLRGCFHFDEGYYFFRNVGHDRILFGGGRNIDIEGETTCEFGTTERIQQQLETYLRTFILPGQQYGIEHRWSGIMGMGSQRSPIVRQLSENVYCGVRLSGTGVAIGSLVGEELAHLSG